MASVSDRALAGASLLLRILTLLLLIASIIVLATNKIYEPFVNVVDPPNFTFRDVYAYRYVMSAAVIGAAYTLLVIPFTAIHVAQRRRIGRSDAIALLIFTDVVVALLIATGAAAGLGLTVEVQKRFPPQDTDSKNFLNLVDVSCALMLGATICMVIMIMISVHPLI